MSVGLAQGQVRIERIAYGVGNLVGGFTQFRDHLYWTNRRFLAVTDGFAQAEVIYQFLDFRYTIWQLAAVADSFLYMAVQVRDSNTEIWRTGGSNMEPELFLSLDQTAGTLTDFHGPVGQWLYFRQFGDGGISTIWATDGTVSQIVVDGDLIVYGQVIVFGKIYLLTENLATQDSVYWVELTDQGTLIGSTIGPLGTDIVPLEAPFTRSDGSTYFLIAQNLTDNFAGIYLTDGTPEGTTFVVAPPNFRTSVRGIVERPFYANVGDWLFYSAHDENGEYRLYKTNGTLESIDVVGEQYTAFDITNPGALQAYKGQVYYAGRGGSSGREVFVSDIFPGNTRQLIDVGENFMNPSSNPRHLKVVGNTLVFWASRDASEYTLYQSDGSTEGTRPVLSPQGFQSAFFTVLRDNFSPFFEFRDTLIFSADNSIYRLVSNVTGSEDPVETEVPSMTPSTSSSTSSPTTSLTTSIPAIDPTHTPLDVTSRPTALLSTLLPTIAPTTFNSTATNLTQAPTMFVNRTKNPTYTPTIVSNQTQAPAMFVNQTKNPTYSPTIVANQTQAPTMFVNFTMSPTYSPSIVAPTSANATMGGPTTVPSIKDDPNIFVEPQQLPTGTPTSPFTTDLPIPASSPTSTPATSSISQLRSISMLRSLTSLIFVWFLN